MDLDEKKLTHLLETGDGDNKIVQTSCRNDEKKRIKVQKKQKQIAFSDFNPFLYEINNMSTRKISDLSRE